MKLLITIVLLGMLIVPVGAKRRPQRVSQEGVVAPANVCEDLDRCISGERIPTNGCQCPTDKRLLSRLRTMSHPRASQVFK